MARAGPKSIKDLSAEILRRFGRQLDDLAVLQGRWHALVGEPMAAHSEPTHYEAGRLTVAADGPAWASRVRQQQAGLLQALRAESAFEALREIKVLVQPTRSVAAPSVAPPRSPSRLSQSAARLVRGVAESVDDPQLRAALKRLSHLDDKKK
jgi:predicted nucleic acid-binding Zn ribbon protein